MLIYRFVELEALLEEPVHGGGIFLGVADLAVDHTRGIDQPGSCQCACRAREASGEAHRTRSVVVPLETALLSRAM